MVGEESELDFADFAILGYIVEFCGSSSGKVGESRLVDKKGNSWTWIDLSKIKKDLPLLKFKSVRSVSARVKKLVKEEFIYAANKRISGHLRMFFRAGKKANGILFSVTTEPTTKTAQAPTTKTAQGGPTTKTAPTQYITSNVINNNELENSSNKPPSGAPEDGKKKIDIFEEVEAMVNSARKDELLAVIRVVGLFKDMSKDWKSFYNPGFQRQAVKRLIKLASGDGIDIATVIQKAKSLHDVPYAPQLFTPQDILFKYDKLLSYKHKPAGQESPPGGAPYTPGRFADKKSVIIKH